MAINTSSHSLFAEKENNVVGVPFTQSDYLQKNISISNSFGVPSMPVEVWSKDFQSLFPYSKNMGSHVVLSFQGSRDDKLTEKEIKNAFYRDIEKTAKLALECTQNTGFSLLEMNLSCPNETHAPLYKDLPSALEAVKCAHRILSGYSNKIKLIAKIGVLTSEETKVFMSECAGMLDAFSAINTVSANIRRPDGKFALGSGSLSGGVCGSLIFEQGVKMVSLLAETREKLGIKKQELGIIGVGGVVGVNEFQSYLSAGADVVQAATGMMWNLNLASEIASSLKVPFDSVLEIS